jgi:Fe2+ transport system protein B
LEKLAKTSKDDLAKDLYFAETFVPPKRRSSLPNIQENFASTWEKAKSYYEQADYITATVMITNKFYQMYFYNDMQDDINEMVKDALKKTA